jgi:hypothetical protein
MAKLIGEHEIIEVITKAASPEGLGDCRPGKPAGIADETGPKRSPLDLRKELGASGYRLGWLVVNSAFDELSEGFYFLRAGTKLKPSQKKLEPLFVWVSLFIALHACSKMSCFLLEGVINMVSVCAVTSRKRTL